MLQALNKTYLIFIGLKQVLVVKLGKTYELSHASFPLCECESCLC